MVPAGTAHFSIVRPTGGVTFIFGAALVVMIGALALEHRLHCRKSLITGLFAVLLLPLAGSLNLLPFGPVINAFGGKVNIPVFVTAVDWDVIAIILGSAVFVDVISQSGLFTWIAITLTKRSKGDPFILLVYYSLLTVLFSALLNNVTAIIIIGSLSAVSLEKLNRKELLPAFLLVEGFLTNVGGLLTLISSVPNIIVGNIAGITFIEFFLVSAPYVLLASVMTVFMGAKIFKISRIKEEDELEEAVNLVEGFDENDGITSLAFFYGSAAAFTALILTFAFASRIPVVKDLGLGYVAVAYALVVLLVFKHNVNRFYAQVDWDLLGFFVFLFVVINIMEHAGVLHVIGVWIGALVGAGGGAGNILLLWSSAAASSVTDNIPLSAVLAKVIYGFSPVPPPSSGLWWSVIFGANLGGNITPIGSASTMMAVAVMQKHGVGISFGRFVKIAAPFALMQLVLASLYVLLIV